VSRRFAVMKLDAVVLWCVLGKSIALIRLDMGGNVRCCDYAEKWMELQLDGFQGRNAIGWRDARVGTWQ